MQIKQVNEIMVALAMSDYSERKRRIAVQVLYLCMNENRNFVSWNRREMSEVTGIAPSNVSRDKEALLKLSVLRTNARGEIGIEPNVRLWQKPHFLSLSKEHSVEIDTTRVIFDTGDSVDIDTTRARSDTPGVGPNTEGVDHGTAGVGFGDIYDKGSETVISDDQVVPEEQPAKPDYERQAPSSTSEQEAAQDLDSTRAACDRFHKLLDIYRDWTHRLREAKNDRARNFLLVDFVREYSPTELPEDVKGSVGRVGAFVRQLKDHQTALRYLWMAMPWEPGKLISYAQDMYKRDRTRPKPDDGGAVFGPREL